MQQFLATLRPGGGGGGGGPGGGAGYMEASSGLLKARKLAEAKAKAAAEAKAKAAGGGGGGGGGAPARADSAWSADARALAATDARLDQLLRARGVVDGLAGLSRAAAEERAARGGGGGGGPVSGTGGGAAEMLRVQLPPPAPAQRQPTAMESVRMALAAGAAAGAGAAAAQPDECTICTDKLGVRNGPGERGTITTACGHRFHRGCINQWLNTGNMKCPLCRADLNPPFVGIAGRRQYGAKRYRKRATRKQGKHYKKKTRRGKRYFRA